MSKELDSTLSRLLCQVLRVRQQYQPEVHLHLSSVTKGLERGAVALL